MKKLSRFCTLVVLVLSLSLFAYAEDGHMSCPGITSPPPESTTDGQMETGLTQAALTIIQSVLLLS
jgi:hypothetical protein